MKNKNTGFLCILMCIVLIASVFVACDSKDGDNSTTILQPASIVPQSPEEPSYSKVLIEGVELADIIVGALGEEYKDTSISELDEEQKEAVKDYAEDKGYIVEEENGKLNIYESKEEEAPSSLVEDIFNQASVKDPSNLTPEEITRLSQIAATNKVELVTKEDGKVEFVTRVPATKVVTTKAPVTQAPNNNADSYKTTIKVEIPSYNPPTVGEVASMGTTLPKTQLAKAGWLKTYGNDTDHYVFTNNATTNDGGVVSVGAKLVLGSNGESKSFGAVVVKYNKDGSVAWQDTIGSDKICQLENVAVLKDGSIVAVGYTSGTKIDGVTDATYRGPKGSVEGIMIKYSADGKTKAFFKMVGGSGADMIYGIAPTSDGGFVIGGKGGSSDGDFADLGTDVYKAFVMKCDANGNIKWRSAISSKLHSAVKNIAVASNGDIYATVETVAEYPDIEGTKSGLETTVLMKLNKDGNIQWKKCFYGAGRTQLYAVAATSDGCVIAGQYASGSDGRNAGTFADIYNGGNQGTFDGMIIKVTADGKQKWMKPLVGFQNDYVTDITAVPGGFALSGYTNSTNRDFALKNNGEADSFVYIISAYGDLQTVSSFGGSASDNARGICSNGKTVYVCGFTNSADGSFANASVKGADSKGAALVYQYNLETT